MIFSINPTKDASIYSNSASINTGLDEVLEVAKVMTGPASRNLTHALIKFDVASFPSTALSNSTPGSRKFYLKLYATDPENLQTDYTIDAVAVSGSWTMGSGKRYNTPPTTTGVSWDFRNGYTIDSASLQKWWNVSASVGVHSDYYGGQWQITPVCSQSFSYETADTNIDVTAIAEQWIAGGFANEGFAIKFSAASEGVADNITYGTLKFFSKDSFTIYKPKLILKYDDSAVGVGVSVAGTLNEDDTVVYIKGLKPQYSAKSVDRIRVLARDRFPQRTFVYSQSQYVSFNYLPTASYYGVKDAYSGEMVVDFDTSYSKLSSDANGNFFNFNFGTLFVGRVYKFIVRVERGSLTQYFDTDTYFKVVT